MKKLKTNLSLEELNKALKLANREIMEWKEFKEEVKRRILIVKAVKRATTEYRETFKRLAGE